MGATIDWFGRQMKSYSKGNTSISYKYDSDGLRTQKVVNGVQYDYYYVDGQLRYEKKGSEYELVYRYNNDGTLASITRYRFSDSSTTTLYAVTNTRGDVIKLLNDTGTVNSIYTYDSWGKLISVTSSTGAARADNTMAIQSSIRYRGYVYDTETGLYYLQSRYYDPETGRFLNADDVDFIGASGTVLGYNAFAYCENNAVNCYDFTGFEKDYINNFAADLTFWYLGYSVQRNRQGTKYKVTLGTGRFTKTAWLNFYYGNRQKFYKQMGFDYDVVNSNIYVYTKAQKELKNTIINVTSFLLSAYLTSLFKINIDKLKWLADGMVGGGINSIVNSIFKNSHKKKVGQYYDKVIAAKIYIPAQNRTAMIYTVDTYYRSNERKEWSLFSTYTYCVPNVGG